MRPTALVQPLAPFALLALVACADDPSAASTAADSSDGGSEQGESSTIADESSTASTQTTNDSRSDGTGIDCGDHDQDGFEPTQCGGGDCDDEDPFTNPDIMHDGWEQLVLHPMGGGGGWRHHAWITGPDGLVDLFYAFNTMLIWIEQENEVVWDGGTMIGTGFEPSVALAPDGSHHIVYVGFTADQQARGIFHMQVGSPDIQTLEALPIENPNPFGLDIAIDPATGTMHVVYGVLYEFPPTLRYARSDDGAAWTVEDIYTDAAGFGGTIVLDDDGVPHVSYSNNDDEVVHATKPADVWSAEVVASGYETAATAMTRDPDGDLHIAFAVTGLEDAEDGLHYVGMQNGEWGEPSEIDADAVWYDEIGEWDYRPAIVADAHAVHVAYHDYGTGALRYAALVDDAWQHQVINPGQGEFSTQAGWDPQLELANGELHISEASQATNEYRHLVVIPNDGADNDCDGMIDEGRER